MEETQKALADRLFPAVKPLEELELRNIPPEQRRLHTETADLTVSSIYQYLANGKLKIPEFQRGYVWTRVQASRLLESLMIQCPIPVVYFSQDTQNDLMVIDGNQRLLSIKLFMNDAFQLEGLTTYPELNGQSWSSLDPRFRDHILNRTLRCITILRDTHPQIKFDVFERLNTGSVQLNSQELRHGINFGYLIENLDELTKNDKWKKAVGIRVDKRMKGAELVLRYFALRYSRDTYSKPLSGFLDQFSSTHKTASPETVNKWAVDFRETMDRVEHALGKLTFRLFEPESNTITAFNSALYDAEMIAFSETTNPIILNRTYDQTEMRTKVSALLHDERFSNSIRRATSDDTSVSYRIASFKSLLDNYQNGV